MYRIIIAFLLLATVSHALPANATVRMATEGYVTNKVAQGVASAVAFATTNRMEKVYAPGSSTTWIDGAGNQYVISNFWNMTFSAGFGREGHVPSQTNYLFTSYTQYYFEGYAWAYWRMRPYEVVYLPSSLTSPSIWNATTNALVLDPVAGPWASGYAYIQTWSTTNLVDSLSYKPSYAGATNITDAAVAVHNTNGTAHADMFAGKVSTTDSTYTATVAKASSALQPSATNDWTVSAHQAWLTSEADTNALTQLDAHKTNGTAHTSLFDGKVGTDRTITVNGSTGTLSSNLSFTVTAGITGATVTNIVNAFTFTNQTWSAAGTNATYRIYWDITNGTFGVQEILP
jgi:hypothetical protein